MRCSDNRATGCDNQHPGDLHARPWWKACPVSSRRGTGVCITGFAARSCTPAHACCSARSERRGRATSHSTTRCCDSTLIRRPCCTRTASTYVAATTAERDRIEIPPHARSQRPFYCRNESRSAQTHLGPMSAHIWAPEIHHIDGKWYIYFTASRADAIWEVRPYVLVNESARSIPGRMEGARTHRHRLGQFLARRHDVRAPGQALLRRGRSAGGRRREGQGARTSIIARDELAHDRLHAGQRRRC